MIGTSFLGAVCVIASIWLLCGTVEALSSKQPMTQALLSRVKAAITATKASQSNITLAYEACDTWSALPISDFSSDSVRAISFVLHATCLARVGRDAEAVGVYQSCLQMEKYLEPMTLEDVKIGRASALQRLMRYDEAMHQFLDGGNANRRGIMGGVTCCLRLGQLERAVKLLETQSSDVQSRAMLETLKLLQGSPIEVYQRELFNAAAVDSPLFRWIGQVTDVARTPGSNSFDHLEVSAINQSPLDDPLLLDLDDKVKLHRLLAGEGKSFWPIGFILPAEIDEFRRYATCPGEGIDKDWILKSRAGYGSHGNEIMAANEVIKRYGVTSSTEVHLCQRMVDPPLLLDNRKFSMRVYVYYFTNGSVFLSNLGLVKLASKEYQHGEHDDCMHMTNSGREDAMLQYDLKYLQDKFQKANLSFSTLWADIEVAVKESMLCFQAHCDESQVEGTEYRPGLALLGIPKILGFDFMVTESLHPMLLEVNRFPGLEPRGDGDELVKPAVVREAWVCASEIMGVPGIVDRSPLTERTAFSKLL